MAYGIPISIITCIIPFIPTTLEYTTRLVVLHFLFTLRDRFAAIHYNNPKAIVALITPNTVERQKYHSIGAIFLGFLRSIFRIVFPIMIRATGDPEEAATDPREMPPEEGPVYMTDSKGNVTVRPDMP